jgi:hypothetical protein
MLLDCEDGKQKELIIDCGSKNGMGTIEKIAGLISKIDGLRMGIHEIKETMLWVTHLHEDHYNGLDSSISNLLHELCNRIGTIIIGGDIEQAKLCADFGRWIQQRINRRISKKPVFCLKVWDYNRWDVQRIVKALDSFRKGCSGDPKFFAIIPRGYRLDASDNENAQSLALGVQYNGVRMLFPGDAPGKTFQSLPDNSKDFVRNVNILIAPHHGSFEADNEWWWCYD